MDIWIYVFVFAGQDTTASAITWMVRYLDDNNEVLNLLRVSNSSSELFLPKNQKDQYYAR